MVTIGSRSRPGAVGSVFARFCSASVLGEPLEVRRRVVFEPIL
jgi:hypothetical protein